MIKHIVKTLATVIMLFPIYSSFCQNLVISDTSKVVIFTEKYKIPLNLDFDEDGSTDVVFTISQLL